MKGNSLLEQMNKEQIASVIRRVQSEDFADDPQVIALREGYIDDEVAFLHNPERPSTLVVNGLIRAIPRMI